MPYKPTNTTATGGGHLGSTLPGLIEGTQCLVTAMPASSPVNLTAVSGLA